MAIPPIEPPAFDYAAARSKDEELYTAWKQNPSKENMGKLIKQLHPLITKEVNRLQGSVPPSALNAEATKWAIKAVQTYDPTKGASLSTHVNWLLMKTRRLNYKVQNAARLAENQQLKFHEFNTARLDLASQLNKEPSAHELSGHLGWTVKQVQKFQNELFNDFYESGSEATPAFTSFNTNKIQWDYVLSNLTEEEKKLLDMITNGEEKRKSADDIAKELGVNINRYNYLKRKLVEKMAHLQREIGEL